MKQFRKAIVLTLLIGLIFQQFFLLPQALLAQESPAPEISSEPDQTQLTPAEAQESEQPEAPPVETEPQVEPAPESEPTVEVAEPSEQRESTEQTEPQTVPEEQTVEEPVLPVAEEEDQVSTEPIPTEPEPQIIEDLSSIGAKEGLAGESEPQTITVLQEDENITVVGKIAGETVAQSNREGLGILKGDIAGRPEEVFFFEEQGVKKQVVDLSELIKKEQAPAPETPSAGEISDSAVTKGGEGIVLEEVVKREESGNAVSVNVEDITVVKKEEGFFQKLSDTIFGGKKDNPKEERVQLEVTSNGEVKLISAENVEGDEKLEIEYSYGSYTKSFEVSFVPMTLDAPFTVSEFSEGELEKAVNRVLDVEAEAPEPLQSEAIEPQTSEPPVETIPVIEPIEPTVSEIIPEQSPETVPLITEPVEPPVSEPTPPIEDVIESQPAVAPSEEPHVTSETVQSAPPEDEVIVPVELPEEGAVQGARVQNFDTGEGTGIVNRIKRFFQSFLFGAAPARAQNGMQTVQTFQVKLKTATVKGEQTFQILPNGLVYLYHGSSIEAISRPRFQYQGTSGWNDFAITNASQGTQTTGATATHFIQYTTSEGDIITLKYDFGLQNNQIFKKQTWTISGDKTVRVLWETLFRAGSFAQKELAVSTLNESGSRTRLYGDIVIDTSDYKGNVAIEEDKPANIVRVYFEKDGAQAPLTIDPSFSVVTGDQFIEVVTPDFQSPGSATGWKIRFNRLKGGGIDQYFSNSLNNGGTNISSSTKPIFNIVYTSNIFKDLSQTQAYSMQVIERGATRLRVRALANLGNDALTITYTVYLAGQIFIDIQNVLEDGSIAGQNGVFQLNQSYAGYQQGYDITDAAHNAVAIDSIEADTALVPFVASDVAGVATNVSEEEEDYIQVALGTAINAMYANGNTAMNQFLLSLTPPYEGGAGGGLALAALAADYQSPDSLTPFTIGAYQGYNNKEGAYEMTAIEDKIKFQMNGADTPRFYPIFKIANWQNANLAAVYAELDNGEIKQDLDYILTFVNGDPNTHTLIFQYLEPLTDARTFYIDPTCTSNATGNWSAAGTWQSCDPNTTDSVTIASGHVVTMNQDVTVDTIYIQQGTLKFDTTARTLTVNEDGVSNTGLIQVGNAAGSNDATFECTGPTSGVHTIKLVTNAGTNPSVGIEVETDGLLNIQGTSSANQNCVVKNDGVTTDGTKNGYIYLKDGSETLIKNAEISYLGTNATTKYGISAVDVDGNTSGEGLIIEGSNVHNNYIGLAFESGSTYLAANRNVFRLSSDDAIKSLATTDDFNIITNNDIYSNTGDGIDVAGDAWTMYGNAVNGNVIGIAVSGGPNYIYNNTLNGNSNDGIAVTGGTGTVIKNNLITINSAEGIDNDGTSTTISTNYYYNNTTATCTTAGAACGDTTATGSGTIPNYVSTTGGNADFLYVSSDSAALGPGLNIFADTAPGTVNVGGRLDYVKNTTDNEEFNWLQQAHDDSSLGAGDTVTAYAVNVASDTVAGNITEVSSIASTYYTVRFDVAEATVVADNDHEGFYAYFTSGANRGRYYLITDSDENTTDTLTVLSEQAATTFTAGDGFTVVDRVYARAGGGANCTGNTANLCLLADGGASTLITWNTNGTVIVDAQNTRTYGIYLNRSNHVRLDGFIVQNAVTHGISGNTATTPVHLANIVAAYNTRDGVSVSWNGWVMSDTITFSNGWAGIGSAAGDFDSSYVINPVSFRNSQNGISNGQGTNNTVVGAKLFGNTSNGWIVDKNSGGTSIKNSFVFSNPNNIKFSDWASNTNNKVVNNTVVGGATDGIFIVASMPAAVIRNNVIAYNAQDGLDDDSGATSETYNYFYGNGENIDGGGAIGTGSLSVTDPGFYSEVSAVVLAAGATTTTVDVTGTQAWTENQWVGAGLTFTGGSCNIAANTWFGITSNSKEMLFFAPAASAVPNTSCTGVITNFYIANTTSATTPLGQGARHDGATEPGTVNMGARLGYVLNDDQASADIKHNWLQDAHDHANVNAGDTITTYTVNEVSDTLGSTLTDNGPYLTLDAATSTTIAAADDYIGFYMYMTSGTNRGKYYLIIDSTTGTPDTISIAATDGTSLNTTGFNPGDGFTIVDRVYARDSGESTNCTGTENLCLSKAGNSNGTAPITWTTSGAVVIDSAGVRSYSIDIAGADYNIVNGFTVIGGLLDGIRLTNVNNSRYANLTVARNTGMGINDGAGNQDNLFETNTVFSNTSHGIGGINQSFVNGNTVYGNSGRGIDVSGTSAVYNNNLYANADSVFMAGADNTIRGNKILRDTQSGIVFSGSATSSAITNNLLLANTTNGIAASSYSGSNNAIRNNIITNTGTGINLSLHATDVSNFNYFYSNTTNVVGGEGAQSLPASGGAGGTDPNYSFDVSATNVTAGSTGEIDLTGTQNWTANQWAGYGLTFIDGTSVCDSDVKNKWFGITANGAEWIAYSPTPADASTITNCAAKITNFALPSVSTTTPLGGGANHAGTAAKVNMGTRLEYVENSDGTRNNGIQNANDAGATGAGDTLTVYAVDEVTSGTVFSAADSGPYVTLTLSTDSIAANDDYIGMYMYMTSGTNASKYYLIIDSATVAGPADTIAINTSATTGFAASDTFNIIDRVYSTTGYTSGATTANARFTKDGSSGSPITWNAVASNTVLIDASGKTYGFYGDTDGTNGLKYNNFQTAGTFTFLNVSNGANLYQGGFGFNTTSVVHDHINWGGATDASTIFTGQYISKIIDMTQADPVYGNLVWTQNATAGTSDVVMHTRSTDTANGSDIGTKTFVGPDGTANTSYSTETGEAIADAHNTHQYFQYRATLTTTSSNTLPELTSTSVSQEAELTSSPFNTQAAETLFNDVVWTESDGASGTIPSGTDVRIQVRSAPDSSGAPGTWTSWCGPNDGVSGSCTSTTYFTDSTGATEAIDDILADATSDQWIQYKILFIQPSTNKPYLNDITLQYVVNTAPTVSVTSASQGSDGVVTVAYSLSDSEEQGEDGAVVAGLYYERAVTIAEDLDISETDIDVSSASTLPASGTILVDNEIISYTGKSGNTLTGGTRAAESSKAAVHSNGANVWVKAVTVSGNVGTITGVNGTPSAKSVTWTANTDIDGVYDATFSIRVAGNDGNAANQVGYATSSDFVLDTKDPIVDTFTVDASANSGSTDVTATLTITKTDDSTATMSIANDSGSVGTTYSAFASPTTWSLDTITSTQKTVYLKLKDAKGNTSTTASAKTPVTPTSLSVVDTSNVGTGDYRLFLSWKKAEATDVPAFSSYKVYRKTGSGGAYSGSGVFTLVSTISAINTNYFINTNIDGTNPITQDTQYDYFVITQSTDGNISYRSGGICGIPNGAADCAEGGGGDDTTAPTIIFTETSGEGTPSNSRVTITFQTYDLPAAPGTIRDAKIDYGTSSGVFTLSQGIPTATSGTSASAPATRAVTLEGLSGSTTYYYRINARDAAGNIGTDDNSGAGYTFTTTNEPGSIISNVQSILINSTTIKITWTTDKVASSQVVYATNSGLTGSTSFPVSPSDSDTNHEVQITGLTAGTTYYYKARSVDANNNTSDSAVYSFTTADTAAPAISQVAATNVTHSSATITFTTDEVASSSVNYGTSVSYGQTSSNGNFNTTHLFNITGLSPETVYYYKVNATDALSNAATNDNSGAGYTFTTVSAPNAVISNVLATTVSTTAVNITWSTTIAATSQVEYGTSSVLTGSTNQPASPINSATSHTISLSGLAEATRYYYRAISGSNQSPIYNFLTGDTTAPAISNISSVYNDKTAVISWITSESATSQVEYGITDAYGSSTALDSLLTASHAVTLISLTPATTYYYRVKSQDGLQNASVSAVQSFTTNAGVNAGTTSEDAAAPTITNITTLMSDVSAIVSWTTNKDTTTQVEYGASNAYGTSSALQVASTKDHIARLADLVPSTTYHFRVKSQDSIGNLAMSADQTFTTNAGKFKYETQTTGGGGSATIIIDKRDSTPAAITNFSITDVGEDGASFSWGTNEPSVTLVGYGKKSINDVAGKKESIESPVTSHTLQLTQLSSGTEYRVQPFAIDAGGNVTQGAILTFATKGEKSPEVIEEEKKEEEEKAEEEKPIDIIEEETISEEGKILLAEEFDKFIKKLEVYLGPPIIVGITVSDITDSSVVISWKTTVPSASILDYGAKETYGELVRLLQFDQVHKVELKGLQENTVYHYRIKGVTESGQLVATQDLVFKTNEIGKIANFSVNDIQEHSVIVSWKSNVPITSEVEFGVVGEDALERQGKDSLAGTHKLLITGLKEKTRYRIRVVSRDAGAQLISNDFVEFTTSIDDRPPVISELEAEGLLTKRDSVRVIVFWQTDEPGTSQVFYEVGVERGRELKQQTVKDENFTSDHTVLINDFQSGALYQIRAQSLDRTGNVGISEDYTIITPKKEENIIDIIVSEFQDAFGFLKR